jgi:hypothetical protein
MPSPSSRTVFPTCPSSRRGQDDRATTGRELECIAQQIGENLLQAHCVAIESSGSAPGVDLMSTPLAMWAQKEDSPADRAARGSTRQDQFAGRCGSCPADR